MPTIEEIANRTGGLPIAETAPVLRNETTDSLEVCIPIKVDASIRFWLAPGDELTADLVNQRVGELDFAMQSDVIRLLAFDMGDVCANVVGVEPGAKASLYNGETDGCADLPEGTFMEMVRAARKIVSGMVNTSSAQATTPDIMLAALRNLLSETYRQSSPNGLVLAQSDAADAIAKAEGR